MLLHMSTKVCKHYDIETPFMNSNQKAVGENQTKPNQRPYHQKLYLQDITIPSDINVTTKEFEELPKCKDLEIEVSRIWDMKAQLCHC